MSNLRGSRRADRSEDNTRRDRRRRRGVVCTLALAIAFAATSVAAQSPGAGDNGYGAGNSHRQRRSEVSTEQAKKPAPPAEVKMALEPWPRLDPGAVFCRTAEDLRQHLAAVSARLDGSSTRYAEAPGCRVIRTRTAVAVLSREGPAHTQVQISAAPPETGWTDAFLPEKRTGH